ncbi:MAG: right-handed parallel beta-helix repeat-containing protein [Candidatus Thorarchaeota archaeon]
MKIDTFDTDKKGRSIYNLGGVGIGSTAAPVVRTATVVVAASDASAESKAQADYVCDGTDDQVEIQAAIDSLPSGGVIKLSEGLFTCSGTISFAGKTNIWLKGAGRGTKIQTVNNLGSQGIVNVWAPASDIKISDLFLDINGTQTNYGISIRGNSDAPPGVERILVSNVWIKDADDDGVEIINSARDVSVINSFFIGTFSDSPLEVGDGSCNVLILGNHINATSNEGIGVNSHSAIGTSPGRIVISNNFISYSVGGGMGAIAIGGGVSFSDIVIVNNIIDSTPDDGICIQFFSDVPYISRLIIQGNDVYNVGRYGIYVRYGDGVIVEGNSVYSSANRGIYIRDSNYVIVSDNYVTDSEDAGIAIYETSYVTVSNNLAEGGPSGYGGLTFYGNVANALVSNNIFTNNDSGILFHSSAIVDTTIIEANNLTGNTYAWRPMSGATLISLRVRNNEGYTTENSGTATITSGNTSVDVTHGLADTPTRVQLTPTTDTAGKRYWVSAKGSTTFTITIDSSHTADISFDWRAEI